jgi:predicted DNA-binding transcriptional regulator AlpA
MTELVNANQVGARIGCSARDVDRMADAGLMPWGLKIGSVRHWGAVEIDAWIRAGRKAVCQKGDHK